MDVVHPAREGIQHLLREDLPVGAGDHRPAAEGGELCGVVADALEAVYGQPRPLRAHLDGVGGEKALSAHGAVRLSDDGGDIKPRRQQCLQGRDGHARVCPGVNDLHTKLQNAMVRKAREAFCGGRKKPKSRPGKFSRARCTKSAAHALLAVSRARARQIPPCRYTRRRLNGRARGRRRGQKSRGR